jgi:hypothetical protein
LVFSSGFFSPLAKEFIDDRGPRLDVLAAPILILRMA